MASMSLSPSLETFDDAAVAGSDAEGEQRVRFADLPKSPSMDSFFR